MENATLKPYPDYKPSGIDWLGEVPAYWEVRRVKELAKSEYKSFVDGDWIESPYITDRGIRLIQTGNIGIGEYREKGYRYISQQTFHELGCTEFQPGDVLICRLGVPVARACLAPDLGMQMITSVDVCIFKPRSGVSPQFLVYQMSSPDYLNWVNSSVRGSTRDRISRSMLGTFSVVVPPLDEQASIVRYLDRTDDRIRRAISAKERLIGLLTEQRQAVIHRAVTRGLNPNVRLKHSGVEWLGDVPEHWEVRRIKSFSVVKRGASPRPIDDPRYFDENGEYAWVRISDVTASNRYLQKTTQRLSEIGQALSVRIEPGNMFLSIAGSVGKPIITKIKCCIHDGFVYFPQFKGDVEFLYRVLSTEGPFAKLGKLGTQLNLNTDTVGSIYIGWPPDEEQKEIVFFLDAESRQIDTAIDKAQRQIDLLREYRTRLIADLVTGRVDVRGTVGDEVELPVS